MHGCGRCPARWTGANVSHCGACHRTFSAVGPFDRHRRKGQCVDPAEIGLEMGANGVYKTPSVPGVPGATPDA